jgi:hypothetical protein
MQEQYAQLCKTVVAAVIKLQSPLGVEDENENEKCDAGTIVERFIEISLDTISRGKLFPNMTADQAYRCMDAFCESFLDVSTTHDSGNNLLTSKHLGITVACALSAFSDNNPVAHVSLCVIPPCVTLVQRLRTPYCHMVARNIVLQLSSSWMADWEPQRIPMMLEILKRLPLSRDSEELILQKCVSSCCIERLGAELEDVCLGMLNFSGVCPQTVEVR